MTPPKPPSFKLKTGRKTKRERIQQDGRLMTNAILEIVLGKLLFTQDVAMNMR